jgi:protein FRA10AC1
LARKYYDRLFKEYVIADLSRYTEGKIGLRWRIEGEVFSGKGQFICAEKRCNANKDLCSYEVKWIASLVGGLLMDAGVVQLR